MFKTLAVLLLSNLAAAQVKVIVGPGLTFTPATITAPNGTIVEFNFSGHHSVTQSTFAAPCTHAGFNSAPLDAGRSFSVKVIDDSRPIWFYCNVATHCSAGMVGVINPPTSGNTFAAFSVAARVLAGAQPPTPDASTVVTNGPGVTAAPPANSSSSTTNAPTLTLTSAAGSSESTAPSASSTGSSALQLNANAGLTLLTAALAFFAA